MDDIDFPPLDPVRAVQDALNNQRKEKIRLAARRRIIVELVCAVADQTSERDLRDRMDQSTRNVVDYAECILTEIEKRYGADW